jgi:signal transduction histidine kinase
MRFDSALSHENPWADWRAPLFGQLSTLVAAVYAPVALVMAIVMKYPGVALFRTMVLCNSVVLALVAIASRRARCTRGLAVLLVATLTAAGMNSIAQFGLTPPGLFPLMSSGIVVAVFLGTWAVWSATVVTTLLILGLGAAAGAHLLHPADPRTVLDWRDPRIWVLIATAYFGTTAIISLMVASLIARLEGYVREREKILAAERKARVAAEQAIGVREEFLALAAHELRTPCTSLGLALQRLSRLAKRGRLGDDEPSVGRLLELAVHQAASLNLLNDRLLEVSRIASGPIPMVLSQVDLVEVAREGIKRMHDAIHASRSAVTLQAEEPIVGHWDRSRLDEVFGNLLSNAIRYGDGKPVEIGVAKDGELARLVVRDEGMGIPPEAQARVFGRFERAASSRHYGGLGLGLYIVQRIVERLGGTVTCDSAVGEGTTFRVMLPRRGPVCEER